MADNDPIELVDGVNTTVASDDIGGVKYPRVKIVWGPDGSATDVSTASASQLPVELYQNGTRLAVAEDAVHISGADGIMALGVRKDSAASLAGTDGDYHPLLVDSQGRLHSAVGSIPAAARVTDTISAAIATDAIMQNLTARTPAYAVIDAATSGDNTIVSAQGASNKIRVYAAFLVATGAVNVRFESGAGGTALTGQMALSTNTGFVLPFNPLGWFETAANTLLNLELSGATSVDGALTWSIVT